MIGEIELKIEILYRQYQTALTDGNIEKIIRFGESYFNALHNGEMTAEERELLQREVFNLTLKDKKK